MDKELDILLPVVMCNWCDKEIENPDLGAALFHEAAMRDEHPYVTVYFFHLEDCVESYRETIYDFDWKEYKWLPLLNFSEYLYSSLYHLNHKANGEDEYDDPVI